MRIVFAGTPDFAAKHLQALLDKGFEIVGVFTQPDRPKGRGHKLMPSPVKEIALEHNISLYQPSSFKKEPNTLDDLKALKPDIMVVVAYGLLLTQEVLDTPKYGCINVHGSLLPRWRGAAPIQRSLWAGDKYTGVTIMKICMALDSGDILHQKSLAITKDDTSETLYNNLAPLGAEGLIEVLNNLDDFYAKAIIQDEKLVTYAAKITKEEGFIDFTGDAQTIDYHIRSYIPWPYAYFTVSNLYLKVHKAIVLDSENNHGKKPGEIIEASKDGLDIACGKGTLRFTLLQLPGKKAMEFKDILNSRKEIFIAGTSVNTTKPEDCLK